MGWAEAIVVGGGAAGLGVAVELGRCGVSAVILEQAREVGGAWSERYDALRLNTCRRLSGIRRDPIPRRLGQWLNGDAFLAYLRGLPGRHRLDVRHGVGVERIERRDGEWLARTTDGDWETPAIVVATGYDRVVKLPDWPGAQTYSGRLLHSSAYRRAGDFRGEDVLVVGPGNSGTEIATQLARGEASRVRLAVRTPVNLVGTEIAGIPATFGARLAEHAPAGLVDRIGVLMQRRYGDLGRHGLKRAPFGIATELRTRHLGPVLERGFADELRAGSIELVEALEHFDGDTAVLADGARIQPQVVIAATGFVHGLERLVGHLGVLDQQGRPAFVDGSEHPDAPGLYFHGFWLPLSGQLPGMRRTAPRIARAISARDD